MSDSEEDPFSCFGEESDDDGDASISDVTTNQSLVEEANKRILIREGSELEEETEIEQRTAFNRNIDLPATISVWEKRAPLFKGPIATVRPSIAGIGGNRGFVASKDLKPGTLLLVEKPIFTWPQEQVGRELGLISIHSILIHEDFQAIVRDMEDLHPTKRDVDRICRSEDETVSENEREQIQLMIGKMQTRYSDSEELKRILTIARKRNITSGSGNHVIDDIDVLRMLLSLRYNGFDSGVYLHFAIFNHDDDPNCIKFLPKYSSSQKRNVKNVFSEVRTTKFVAKGEPLTLHYLNPRETSHSTRRQHLWDQHRFDIGREMKGSMRQMELINELFPPSSKGTEDRQRITFLVENSLSDLENIYSEIKPLLSLAVKFCEVNEKSIEAVERLMALEIAGAELLKSSAKKLQNENHVLLIRCCRLQLDSIELLLKISEGKWSLSLSNDIKVDLMCKFVPLCTQLLSLQLKYLGSDHPDIARTSLDLSMGIKALLAQNQQRLFDLKLKDLDSFYKCSYEESRYNQEYHRIKDLYPFDAELKLVKS